MVQKKIKNKNLILNKNFLLSSKIFDEKLVLNVDADFRSNNFFQNQFSTVAEVQSIFRGHLPPSITLD